MRAGLVTVLVVSAGLAGCSAMSASGGGSQYDSSFGASGSLAGTDANSAIANLLTNDFAKKLDASDHRAMIAAQKQALRTDGVGASIAWENVRTGRNGTVRPGPVYHVNDTTCREFVHELVLEGAPVKSRGTACKAENGSWQTLS